MRPIISLILFAACVTMSHTLFLTHAKPRLWNTHLAINGTLWLMLFAWILLLQWQLPHEETSVLSKIIGVIFIAIGMGLVTKVRLLFGREQAMGVRFFFPQRAKRIHSNLFRYFNNPMYDGFLFVLVGLGLTLGITSDFWLAGMSFLLLNLFLARVENFEKNWNPF